MATTHLYSDAVFEQHDAGTGHPESPQRLKSILALLKKTPLAGASWHVAREASRDELTAVHQAAHVDALALLRGQRVQLDPDTAMSEQSYEAALKAAGAGAQAVEAVLSGQASNAFALVRPPGHHAEARYAMGFCLFNNVAVAAQAARARGLERIAIVDWDVHHGNGTQHTFWNSREVLFCSAHQYPFYPGTGGPSEIGEGAGAGYTVNAALPAGLNDADYGVVFHDLFLPVLDAFRPQLILVSAGFDAHRFDPLGQMQLTERGYAAMCSALLSLAQKHCQGRLVLMLEGGYHLDALAQSVHACVEVLTQARTDTFPQGAQRRAAEAILPTRKLLKGMLPSPP